MRIKTVVGLMAAVVLVGFSANQAKAQFLRHGISVQKGCDGPFCVGDTTSCTFLVSYNDDYGDTTMIMEAYDRLDTDGDGTFETRIPAAGNLPIIEVGGNTTCTVGGSLPCNLGAADLGAGLEAGFVIFQQNEYVIDANDVSPLEDQGHVIWQDQCDAPGTSNCSTAVNDANAPAATLFPICNDDDACTNDSCAGGECSFESVCLDPNYDCDDSDVCTADRCDDTMAGCCAHDPIPCEERACYNNTGCDPTDGCQYESVCADPNYNCDDSNVCTADSCDEGVDGCCNHVDIPCDPRACYNNTGCDPTDGCQYESVCTDPAYCDDSNVCTADSCDEGVDGCCNHEDIPCEPRACYNNTGCDPTDGCQYESVCADPNYDCDDHNVCTTDTCNESAAGCCAHEDIPCEERPCYTIVGCDPVSGCQYEPVTCDDGDRCTEDSCNPDSGACEYVVIDPPPIGCGLACRVTGGGVDTYDRLSYGQSKKGDASLAEGVSDDGGNSNRYTMGGQAGAPTAEQPQPYGEWTHHNQRGHNGKFVFHAGTASAPDMTEIDLIECSDAGWCVQARPAPAKQIDFQGVGAFNSLDTKAVMSFHDIAPAASFIAGETLHWFSVHIEDLGEPGQGGAVEPPADFCPLEGSAGALANCGCPDFYEIRIHATADPSSPMVYHVYGYITGGNLQIHPPILRSSR